MITAFQSFLEVVAPDCDNSGLQTLNDIIEELDYAQGDNPKIFASNISMFLSILQNHISEAQVQQKTLLIEFAVSSVQSYPKIFKKHMQSVEKLLNLIIFVMVNIPNEIPQMWFKPKEGFNQDDNYDDFSIDPGNTLVTKLRVQIDLIASSISYRLFVKKFGQILIKYFNQSTDWRWRSGILMIISQLSEQLTLNKIEPFLALAINGANDPHPKVRHASAQMIGQFSEDLSPKFQEKYFESIFPLILQKFGDPVQRVAAHWIACLTNFLEEWNQTTKIYPYIEPMISRFCYFLENGMSVTKENSISGMATLATIVSLFDSTSIQKPFQICKSVFINFSVDGPYHQLINQTVQCATLLLQSQAFPVVAPYIGFVMEILTQFGYKLSNDYLFAAWARICSLQKSFSGWENVYPIILQKVVQISSDADIQMEKHETAFLAIESTAQCFKGQFIKYASETLKKLSQILKINTTEQSPNKWNVKAINVILKEVRFAEPNPDWQTQKKQFIILLQSLMTQLYESQQFNNLSQMLQEFTEIIENSGDVLKVPQIPILINKFFSISTAITQTRNAMLSNINPNTKYHNIQNQDESQQDGAQQPEIQQDDFQGDDKLQVVKQINIAKSNIPDVITALLKIIPSNNQSIFGEVTNFIETQSLQAINQAENNLMIPSNQNNNIVRRCLLEDIRCGVYIIDNLIENLNYQQLMQNWNNFASILMKYSISNCAVLRNSACFGLSMLTQKIPLELASYQMLSSWIQIFKTSYMLEKGQEDTKKQFFFTKDNCVAAIGKIIRRFGNNFSAELDYLYQGWISCLPLKYDKDENKIQIKLLIYLVTQKPQKIVKNESDLFKIIKILSKVVKDCIKKIRRKENREFIREIKGTLLILTNWQIFKKNEQQIFESMTTQQKFNLTNLLTNDIYTYE